MAQTFTGRKRVRKVFGHVREVGVMPNLIEVQKASYDQFLIMDPPKGGRPNEGLQSVFKSVFPISDFAQTAQLEFVKYEYEAPKYDVDECRQRGMTYAAPLKVTLRLIVFDVDPETQARSVKDIKEQDVYMGDMPLMTANGTFVVNGTERVIVSQMHRSPGVFFDHDKGKSHSSGKLLFAARIIPYRGSWLDIEFDAKDIVHARIDRRRKIPVTSLLFALGLDGEEILSTFYKKVMYSRAKDGWRVPFDAERMKGLKATVDLIDADTGEVVIEAGRKLTVRSARQLSDKGVKALRASDADLYGQYIGEDLYSPETGEIFAEAGEEITDKSLAALIEKGFEELPILDIDHVNVGPYIRNTLKVDKNSSREDALFDIYRVMRPGEPPTVESAEAMFNSLFFDSERYDLSAVGRVKMNMRLDLDAPDTVRILRKEDILAVVKALVDLRDGRGEIDDIDHLGNRRVRSVGELMENQYRVGLLRMERAIKERMSSVEIDTIMPQDLINAKPAAAAVREFFGSSQLSQFMDQTNPLSEITHKRRLSALGPGGLTRERAGFEVRDVHPTHYGRICPIETPEGPNIGLISSLSCFARINEYGFIESPYRRVVNGVVQDDVRLLNPGSTSLKVSQVLTRKDMDKLLKSLARDAAPPEYEAHSDYLSAWDEDKYLVAQANVKLDADGRIVDDLVNARKSGNYTLVHRDEVQYMDVSPKQLVSVAASLIPFLENDDANRALMGSNMQRQAVPLLRANSPIVGTGMERVTARDSGATIICKRSGIVDSVDSERIIVRVEGNIHEGQMSREVGADIYPLTKFKRSNQNTCINQKPIVDMGQRVKKGDVLADGPCTDMGELALGRNVLVAFMPWRGYNFEDAIVVSEKLIKEDYYTSIHIEEFEIEARDTKLGPEEITRDIPNISETFLRNLDESGIIRVGAKVKPGDILVGKVTPKGETQLTPEEKLLRAIFGEKAGDVKDASLYCPPGIEGVVVDAKVFSRKGADLDTRSRAILETQIEKLHRNLDDEKRILQDERAKRLAALLEGKELLADLHDEKTNKKLLAKGTPLTRDIFEKMKARDLKRMKLSSRDVRLNEAIDEVEELTSRQIQVLEKITEEKIAKLKKGDELPPGVIKLVKIYIAMRRKLSVGDKMAGRHGNKGVISRIVPDEDMPYLDDGTPVEIVLNPLGVPSRMNVGQILETHLGWAGMKLGKKYATPVFDGATEADIKGELAKAELPGSGKVTLFDGLTGQAFEQPVTVGYIYMLKLSHLVDDKIHARSIGPYSLITQQPLGGKAQFGGQRFGEMEVWALEAYGAAYVLQELLTAKSDDVFGRAKIYEAIVKGEAAAEPGVPESFNVLIRELQSLCLDVELMKKPKDVPDLAHAAD
jgi:DNA-directed RNA polymerase subunit beta